MMRKQIISTVMLSALVLSKFTGSAYAETTNVTEAGGQAEAKVTLTVEGSATDPIQPVEPTVFSATVPKVLPVSVNKNTGAITVADNLKIVNNVTTKGIKVTEIKVQPAANWTISEYNNDFTTVAENTPTFGMALRGDEVSTDGSVNLTEEYWSIAKDTSINLNMEMKFPPITESIENSDGLATVGFTLDWSGDDTSTENTDPPTSDSETGSHA